MSITWLQHPRYVLGHGDCLDALRLMPGESIDSLITDPPAGIGFMAKEWDSDKGGRVSWISWLESVMREALRVMKPGAHGLVWALPRTSHWTATALEQAEFEIRDVITHHFATGFPKSLDLEKAVDAKTPGAGEMWRGQGTALKPATENWILVRKPLSGTTAENVMAFGTGGLNIDACRIGDGKRIPGGLSRTAGHSLSGSVDGSLRNETGEESGHDPNIGRWPASLVLSHTEWCEPSACLEGCPVRELDRQSGGASRFFFTAKPSTKEREEGCADLPKKKASDIVDREEGSVGINNARAGAGRTSKGRANTHPTVKSTALMTWLAKLITPPGGTILDPFMGSGTTGRAAMLNGFKFVGMEREIEFAQISAARIGALAK